MTTPTPADLIAADEAFRNVHRTWNDELCRLFKNASGGMRFTEKGRGKTGSPLNKAWLAVREAVDAWNEMERKVRGL